MKNLLIFSVVLVTGVGIGMVIRPVLHLGKREPIVIGRVENVGVDEANTVLKARIDTGAGVTSINAKILEIKRATVPGEYDRVVFLVENTNGRKEKFDQKVIEWQEIKEKGGHSLVKRPVVIMDLCIGGKKIEGRVNLADRSDFIYPILIGRNFLKTGDFYINPKRKFLHKPGCK